MFNANSFRLHPRRFSSWIDISHAKYGGRVQKVSIAADFTCPNRDGTKGTLGCTFCNNAGFIPQYARENPNDITLQIDTGLEFLRRRYPRTKLWVAYFQAYSNTYGEIDRLIETYQTALRHRDISGLVIGTRPDCVSDDLLDYLAELSERYLIELELGVESTCDQALVAVNRGHDFACSVDAIERAAARDLSVSAHLLFGLPGESRDSMLAAADVLSKLPLASLKFHQLQIVKGTQMANQWRQDPASLPIMPLDDYVELLADFVERLNPNIAIQRVGSEVPPSLRLAPDWSLRLSELAPMLTEKLALRRSWHGSLWRG